VKVEIRFCKLQRSRALEQYAVDRARRRLGRFANHVSSVVVRLTDINGPKGGPDKQCLVTVDSSLLGSMASSFLGENAYAAVDLCIKRAARAVDQKSARLRRRG
jgi:hypothetical protein